MICIFTSPVLLKCFLFYLFIYFILYFTSALFLFSSIDIDMHLHTHTRKVLVYENTLGHDHYSDSVSILNSN